MCIISDLCNLYEFTGSEFLNGFIESFHNQLKLGYSAYFHNAVIC